MPTRYEQLAVFQLLEGLQKGDKPSTLTVAPENADEFTQPVVCEDQFARHKTELNEGLLSSDFDFSASAETFDITPDTVESQKESLRRGFGDGEVDEQTYLDFMNSLDEQEDFNGQLLHTIWWTRYFLSRYLFYYKLHHQYSNRFRSDSTG